MRCYRVYLETTNATNNTANVPGAGYVSVEDGQLFVIATDMAFAARLFPNATQIMDVGVGWPFTLAKGEPSQRDAKSSSEEG